MCALKICHSGYTHMPKLYTLHYTCVLITVHTVNEEYRNSGRFGEIQGL